MGAADDLSEPFDETELLNTITGRLARIGHRKPSYNLREPNDLGPFPDDARATAGLTGLSADCRVHAGRKKPASYLFSYDVATLVGTVPK